MQKELSAYFAIQKVVNLHLFNVNFEKHQKPGPVRPGIRGWYEDYQFSDGHSHMGEIGLSQVRDEMVEVLRTMFNDHLKMSLRSAATRLGLRHTTV